MLMRSESQARVRNGGTLGSATCVRRKDGKLLWLTNAHVSGTNLGKTMQLEIWFLGGQSTVKVEAVLKFAAYQQGTSVDFAILESDDVAGVVPIPISANGRCKAGHGYSGGSPRGELTQYKERHYNSDDLTAGIYYSLQNAIGGESGSGILDALTTRVTSLLTWTNGTYCMSQNSTNIARILREGAITVSTDLPPDAKVACDSPQNCSNGVAKEASVDIEGLFIECSDSGNPPTEPPTEPEDRLERIIQLSNVIEMLAKAEKNEEDEVDFDWFALIELLLPIILEIIRNRR